MSMDDVRQLELETQKYLLMKMNNDPRADDFLTKSNSKLNLNLGASSSSRAETSSVGKRSRKSSHDSAYVKFAPSDAKSVIREEMKALLPLVNGGKKDVFVIVV